MKKIFKSIVAILCCGAIFASCQQELDQPETAGKTVTFTVEAPAAIQTKAIADGLNVNQLIYEVWITNDGLGNLTGSNAQRLIHADDVTMTAGKAEITVDLVNCQNFTILFWAQKKDMGVYNTANLNAVTYNEEVTEGNMTVHAANVDDLAAFYGVAYVVDNVAVKPLASLFNCVVSPNFIEVSSDFGVAYLALIFFHKVVHFVVDVNLFFVCHIFKFLKVIK